MWRSILIRVRGQTRGCVKSLVPIPPWMLGRTVAGACMQTKGERKEICCQLEVQRGGQLRLYKMLMTSAKYELEMKRLEHRSSCWFRLGGEGKREADGQRRGERAVAKFCITITVCNEDKRLL